jgi:glycosyltransferase involved in cell wall biosynthesis
MISIITVVRNSARMIEATLKSVLRQKTTEVEYIVIDGASTDGTLEVIQAYKAGIDTFLSEPDGGIYQALNKGIKLARGSLIGLVHSGDILLPDVLDKIAAEHASHPKSILYGCIKAMKNGKFESVWGWNADTIGEHMIPHPGCFVPKAVFEELGLYDESYRIAGDYEAFLRYFTGGVEFRFLDLIIQEFNLQGVSQTQSFKEELKRIQRKYPICKREGPADRLRSSLGGLGRRAFRGIKILAFQDKHN